MVPRCPAITAGAGANVHAVDLVLSTSPSLKTLMAFIGCSLSEILWGWFYHVLPVHHSKDK